MLKRILLLTLLLSPLSAHATIMVLNDTATDFSGTFFVQGNTTPRESLFPTAFLGLLPTGGFNEGIQLARDIPFLGRAFFGVGSAGQPDNPFVFEDLGTTIADLSGTFNNGPNGTLVYFLFTGIINEADPTTGIFSGNFAFSTSPIAAVPLPAAAWLFITALGGLIGAKKLRRS